MVLIAFRVAYAVGQTIAGRVIDRLGTRARPEPVGAVVLIAAMPTSLATVSELRCVPIRPRTRRGRQLARRDESVAEWFPRRETGWAVASSTADRRLAGRSRRGSSDDLSHVRQLEAGVRRSPARSASSGWSPFARSTIGRRTTAAIAGERDYILANRTRADSGEDRARRWRIQRCCVSADVGLHPIENLHRSGVVLHHRLVRHLSRGEGFTLEESLMGFLVPFLAADLGKIVRRRASRAS